MKLRRCEDEKMRYRPPLLEEPCAQTLSGKRSYIPNYIPMIFQILLLYYYHASYSHAIPILFPLLRRILLCERFTPCFTFGAFGTSGPNGRWASQQCPLPAAGPGDFWVKNRVFLYPLVNIQKTMENHHF